jgi:sRNA-binding protein
MCGGNNAHHAQEEAKRAAARQAAAYEEAMRQQEQRNAATLEAMKPKYTPPPVDTGAQLSDNQGVRRKKTRKSTTIDASRGIASLRIPLNTGNSGSGSGPNMG